MAAHTSPSPSAIGSPMAFGLGPGGPIRRRLVFLFIAVVDVVLGDEARLRFDQRLFHL